MISSWIHAGPSNHIHYYHRRLHHQVSLPELQLWLNLAILPKLYSNSESSPEFACTLQNHPCQTIMNSFFSICVLFATIKHCKNCQCCPVSLSIAGSLWLSRIKFSINCLKHCTRNQTCHVSSFICWDFHRMSVSVLGLCLWWSWLFGTPGRFSPTSIWIIVTVLNPTLFGPHVH